MSNVLLTTRKSLTGGRCRDRHTSARLDRTPNKAIRKLIFPGPPSACQTLGGDGSNKAGGGGKGENIN